MRLLVYGIGSKLAGVFEYVRENAECDGSVAEDSDGYGAQSNSAECHASNGYETEGYGRYGDSACGYGSDCDDSGGNFSEGEDAVGVSAQFSKIEIGSVGDGPEGHAHDFR